MKKNSKKLRTLVALAIVAVVTVGFVTNVGIGTMSAPGIWDISILCPLGALGTMLASKMMVPRSSSFLYIFLPKQQLKQEEGDSSSPSPSCESILPTR